MFPPDILLPGPTPIPAQVEQAMLTPMSDHRGAVFTPVHDAVRAKLGQLFEVPEGGGVAVLPASGTGALEAVAQNFFAPGDPVLAVVVGGFGQRFADIAQAMGLEVDRLEYPWGQPFAVSDIIERLGSRTYRGVLVTHNETSTGVTNPVETLAAAIPQTESRPLLLVDSISGVPSLPLSLADGRIDVIIAGSQKGFMCPPGLAVIVAGPNARERLAAERIGRYYFNLQPYFAGQLPYTPAVSLWYGLNTALDLLLEEGAQARLDRHRLLARMARAFGEAGGLKPLVEEEAASPTVTALSVPTPLTPAELRKAAGAHGLQIAGGMGPWHANAIRIGHVGAVTPQALLGGLGILAHFVPHPQAALLAAFDEWHHRIQTTA